MSSLHIRIDTASDHKIFEYLRGITERYIIATEKQRTNLHTHMCLETSVPVQTIRNHIRKAGFVGNGSYSVSQVRDLQKTVSYIMKDGDYETEGFSEEFLEECKEYVDKVQEDQKRKKPKNTLKAIEELLPEDFFKRPKSESTALWNTIIKYHLDNELLIRKFQIRAYYDTIMCKYNKDYWRIMFE